MPFPLEHPALYATGGCGCHQQSFVLVPGEGGELTELAFADFDAGTYRLEGDACNYSDLFSSGTVGAGNSALGGNALTSDAAATSALYSLLAGSGFTLVLDLAGGGGGEVVYAEMHEPGWAAWWDLKTQVNGAEAYEFLFDAASGSDFGDPYAVDALVRLAISMSSAGIACSFMGEAQNAEAGPPGDWEQLTVFEFFNSNNADIKKAVFYSIQPDADLPTLSAL